MADSLLELISRLEDEIQDPDEGTFFFLSLSAAYKQWIFYM
jgi:hypothetical protein